jgi:hypothetical protein
VVAQAVVADAVAKVDPAVVRAARVARTPFRAALDLFRRASTSSATIPRTTALSFVEPRKILPNFSVTSAFSTI